MVASWMLATVIDEDDSSSTPVWCGWWLALVMTVAVGYVGYVRIAVAAAPPPPLVDAATLREQRIRRLQQQKERVVTATSHTNTTVVVDEDSATVPNSDSIETSSSRTTTVVSSYKEPAKDGTKDSDRVNTKSPERSTQKELSTVSMGGAPTTMNKDNSNIEHDSNSSSSSIPAEQSPQTLLREQRLRVVAESQRATASMRKEQPTQPLATTTTTAPSSSSSVAPSNKSTTDASGTVASVPSQPEADIATTVPQPPPVTLQKSPKKKRAYPATQVLCDALSHVFHRTVQLHTNNNNDPSSNENDGTTRATTWGSEDWIQRRPPSYAAPNLTLRFVYVTSDGTVDDDRAIWETLSQTVFPRALNTTNARKDILDQTIQTAAIFHARSHTVEQNGSMLLPPGCHHGIAGLKQCMQALQKWLVEQVLVCMKPDLEFSQFGDEGDDSEGESLFSHEYTQDPGGTATKQPESTLDSLFHHLEEATAIVSSNFVEDIFRHCKTMEEEHQCNFADSILRKAFRRLRNAIENPLFSCATLNRRIVCISNLFALSKTIRMSFCKHLSMELDTMKDKNGVEIQKLVLLAPLFEAAALSIPCAGQDTPTGSSCLLSQLNKLEDFPLCIFRAKPGDATTTAVAELKGLMTTAREVTETVLRTGFKTDKETMFQWISTVVQANHDVLNLLKSDLLSTAGIVSKLSSRSFMLGLSYSLTNFCVFTLRSRLDKMGVDAFDASYLTTEEQHQENSQMFQGSKFTIAKEVPNDDTRREVAGATRFFFLSSLCMRVALYPSIRIEQEFLQRYHQVLNSVKNASTSSNSMPSAASLQSMKPLVAAWIGWRNFLDNPDVASTFTNFTVVQLGWLVAFSQSKSVDHSIVPDWMCRDPARWLSRLAMNSSSLLSHSQAEKVVESVTLLLDRGDSSNRENETAFKYSPIVVMALIGIISNFVQAGVRRARRKEQSRSQSGTALPTDDRDLEVYLSFDKNDLGVTVFTNRIVSQKLSPSLARTFYSVDVVEGLDADKDGGFSKFSAKSTIAELLLRLWNHPAGECQKSFRSISTSDLLTFTSSLSSAVLVDWDFGSGAFKRIQVPHTDASSVVDRRLEQAYLQQSKTQASGMFLGLRRYLALFCAISHDDNISLHLGGGSSPSSSSLSEHIASTARMVISLLDTLTCEEGGTHPSLEKSGSVSTSHFSKSAHTKAEVVSAAADVVRRRIICKLDYGLDVSVLSHTLLALATKWHLTTVRATKNSRTSPFLTYLAEHEDCDHSRMVEVFQRLVQVPKITTGSQAEHATTILRHDGYVNNTAWVHQSIDSDVSESQKALWAISSQDQMSHDEVSKLASEAEIQQFLDHLKEAVCVYRAKAKHSAVSLSDVAKIERAMLSQNGCNEDRYAECLEEWLVSSESFLCRSDETRFVHKYDKEARKHSNGALGNTIVTKEARKCKKQLPPPMANTSIFVCFAEERMDLCRSVVTGPMDTPYAHGIFVFDILFPPSYPHSAPLVTFMTTGGGQVRFNPNLYTDGKVCISLLGSTNATHESQRWDSSLSSLAQVMISIESQIFGVADPYFNEGNGIPHKMKYTESGRKASFAYNNTVRLATIRYAMIAQIRSPPHGFEDVTVRHFSLCKRRILVQTRRWMLEARRTDLKKRFERAYTDLLLLLEEKCQYDKNSLEPLSEDIEAVRKLDPDFLLDYANDSKPRARTEDSVKVADENFNPWATTADASVQELDECEGVGESCSLDDTEDLYA